MHQAFTPSRRGFIDIGTLPARLPYQIIWPGFIINTHTYAAAWFLILLAARRATRTLVTRRRLLRGLCPACRYNLLGDFSSGCPECGWNRPASVLGVPHSGHTPDMLPDRS